MSFQVEDIESLYKEFSNKSLEESQPLRKMPYAKNFMLLTLTAILLLF